MIELNVNLRPGDIARFRTLLTASPRMAAQSLTFTAERAQTAWRAENHRVFHMRRDWVDKGVRIRAATPGNLNAQVGSVDKFMERHLVGFGREKRANGDRLFVPRYDDISKVPTHTVIRRMLRNAASTKTKPFLMRMLNGETALVRRLGKARGPLTILGVLRQKARMRPKLDALHVVDGAVRASFPTVYERLLLKWAERENATG